MNYRYFNVLRQQKSPALLLLVAILAYVFPQALNSLEFNRAAIEQYEYWRLFTGHFFHTNLNHLLLNFSGIVLLWLMHGQFYQTKVFFLLCISSCLLTSLSLLLFTEISLYVGLSGILHGIFLWGALRDIQTDEKTGYLLVLSLVAKLTYEQVFGASAEVASLINANVAVDAHLYGAISGLIFFIGYSIYAQQVVNHHKE